MLEKENLFVNSYSPPSCIAKKFQQTECSQSLSNGGYRKDYEQMQQMFAPKPEVNICRNIIENLITIMTIIGEVDL